MAICPWCKGFVPSAQDKCPLCGKLPQDHPSVASSGFAALAGFDGFEEPPDLEVAAPNAPVGSAQGVMPEFPGDFADDDFGDGASLPLELGVDPRQDRAVVTKAPLQPVAPPVAAAPQSANRASDLVDNWMDKLRADKAPATPSEPAPEPAEAEQAADKPQPLLLPLLPPHDPVEIALLADYGPPPEQAWLAPLYAFRVWKRKRELTKQLAAKKDDLKAASDKRDDHLAALAERVHGSLVGDESYKVMLELLSKVEQTTAGRKEALAESKAKFDALAAQLDAGVAELDEQLSQVGAKRKQAMAVLDERAAVLQRAQAHVKRVEIELRNTQELARTAAAPGSTAAPPEYAGKLRELEQQLAQRRADVQEPQQAHTEARQEVEAVDREYSSLERQKKTLLAERTKAEQAYSREVTMRSQVLEQAHAERRSLLLQLGARLIADKAAVVTDADRKQFEQRQQKVAACASEVERYTQAIGSADTAAVRRGWAVAAGALGALIVLVVLLIVLLGSGAEPPPRTLPIGSN